MSHTETRVVSGKGEVVLLSGPANRERLCKVAEQIHAQTGALVLVDHIGDMRLTTLDVAEMRNRGWVRIEELPSASVTREACGDGNAHGPHDGCDGIPLPPIEPTT